MSNHINKIIQFQKYLKLTFYSRKTYFFIKNRLRKKKIEIKNVKIF